MFDAEELSRMTPQERLRLRRALAELDNQDQFARTRDRRRKILLAAIIVCCICLAAWTFSPPIALAARWQPDPSIK